MDGESAAIQGVSPLVWKTTLISQSGWNSMFFSHQVPKLPRIAADFEIISWTGLSSRVFPPPCIMIRSAARLAVVSLAYEAARRFVQVLFIPPSGGRSDYLGPLLRKPSVSFIPKSPSIISSSPKVSHLWDGHWYVCGRWDKAVSHCCWRKPVWWLGTIHD